MRSGRFPSPALLALVAGLAGAQERPAPTPLPAETPRPEPMRPEPVPFGYRRVTAEPTPTATPTPVRTGKLVAALESAEGTDIERVAVFDDGTLVHVQTYRDRKTIRRKELTAAEVDVVRRVAGEALLVPSVWAVRERAIPDLKGRRTRLEVAGSDGALRVFETDDLTQLPLPVGRARGAMEDLRSRFFRSDPTETAWDPKDVRKGDLLRYRADGSFYVVVRDDAFESSLELQEAAGLGNRMLLNRSQLPGLFEDPVTAARPTPTPRR